MVKLSSSLAIPTGIGNTLGNKGGIGSRITLLDKLDILFVGCHLAAGQSNVQDRNEHVERISSGLVNEHIKQQPKQQSQESNSNSNITNKQSTLSQLFPLIFWAGDMNYRIDCGRKVVDELLRGDRWDVMREIDQLKLQQLMGSIFQVFVLGLFHLTNNLVFFTTNFIIMYRGLRRVRFTLNLLISSIGTLQYMTQDLNKEFLLGQTESSLLPQLQFSYFLILV